MVEKVKELSANEFNDFVKEGFVLVDFFAEWCMPCLMMAPILEELAELFEGEIKFGKINVSDNEIIAERFNVSSIPNFTLFKDGKVVKSFVGAMSEEDFEEKLRELIE